jgi:hypothetical protein
MRFERIVSVLSLLAAAAIAVGTGRPAAAQGALDGRAFTVSTTEPGEQNVPDHLTFVSGSFESMGCRPFGFTPVAYTAAADGDATTFTATSTSLTEGSIAWSGRIDGDQIDGNATWTKEGQDPMSWTYTGHAASGSLDGRSFHVSATDSNGQTEEDDLTFNMGAFESVGCREYGFFPITYTASAGEDGSTAFTATTYSAQQGVMHWSGSVNGDAITGSYTWEKEGQAPMTANFTGTASH